MTDDPAAALADLLEAWRVVAPGVTSEAARELGDPGSQLTFWSYQSRAFDLVGEVERSIVFLEQNGRTTSHYRRHLLAIYGAIGGFTVPFRTAHGHEQFTIDENAIDQLRSLSDVLHAMDVTLPDSVDFPEQVAESVRTVRSLLTDYPDLDRQSRAYLLALANELEQALTDADTFGTALIRRLSTELAGVLFGQAVKDADSDVGRAKRFWGAAKQMLLVVSTAATTKAIDVGGDEFLRQISGSGN